MIVQYEGFWLVLENRGLALKVGNERNADGEFQPLSLLSVCRHVAQLRSGPCFEAVSHSGFTQSMWQDDPPSVSSGQHVKVNN